MTPTQEQQEAVSLALSGEDLTIEALAGCGKTSTLRLISEANRNKQGAYIAFNKAIVTDAASKFPSSVACSTAHSLAYKAVGHKFRNRLSGERQLFREVAKILGICDELETEIATTTVSISVGEQVALIKGTVDNFCRGGDEDFQPYHIPVTEILRPWAKEFRKAVGDAVLPKAQDMWDDLNRAKGRIKFDHNHYLKMWQLQKPVINSDFILFDEAQDANGVMLAIVQSQTCQKIFVGDSYQQIYSWNGAINAMQKTKGNRCWLTESWRFGQGIANVANDMLAQLECPASLIGRGKPSTVAPLDGEVDAILYRGNAACVHAMINAHDVGLTFHLVGGVSTIQSFTEAAGRMIRRQRPNHPELNPFESWGDVIAFSGSDEADGDLARLVRMIETHGVAKILEVLASNDGNQHSADVTISTAHKAKGCEWNRVQIGHDFSPQPSDEEKRLLYVAATRAKNALDHSSVSGLFKGQQS